MLIIGSEVQKASDTAYLLCLDDAGLGGKCERPLGYVSRTPRARVPRASLSCLITSRNALNLEKHGERAEDSLNGE